jgi:hypothetical protein
MGSWTFTLKFLGTESGMPELLQKQYILLQLGGIDTFGTVTLNEHLLLKPNNFHRCCSSNINISTSSRGVRT